MSDTQQELSSNLQRLSESIRASQTPVRVVYCGFDLWLEVMGSGFTRMCNFKAGGKVATEEDEKDGIVIPILVIGQSIVVNFDPTLPPKDFQLKA